MSLKDSLRYANPRIKIDWRSEFAFPMSEELLLEGVPVRNKPNQVWNEQ